jgi:fermentation-respiration switch protein FrsA (DUF1100 family)
VTENVKTKKQKAKKIAVIVSLAFIGLLLGISILIPVFVMPMFLGQRFERRQFNSVDFGIESERVTLTTNDSLALAAWRTKALTDAAKGTVIILSGIQNPSVTAFFGYAKMFSDNGWDTLLIEMRARSQSEGDEIGLGMKEWLDVKAGVDFLSSDENVKNLPIVAMGTSMGGGTVIIAAGELPRINAVISISAFSTFADLFVDNMSMFGMPKFLGIIDIPFLSLYIGLHFGFDALKYSPINGIAKLGERPILMMHSTGDTQVPYSEFERLLKTAQSKGIQPATFIREGDFHFICYDEYFDEPTKDTEFSQAIIHFLAGIFK